MTEPLSRIRWASALAALVGSCQLALAAGSVGTDAPTCTARSAATVAPLVELYTSEGCNSCPPADRWLSRLSADPGVVALAFHVDYWDRLGWKDRFGSPEFTQRQAQQRASNGARFSYTPQVVVDGRDLPGWHSAPLPSSQTSARAGEPARVAITLSKDGARFSATVNPAAGAPARLAAYWAVTEQGHVTPVKAGENQGVTLKHDFVVREYQPVAAWAARDGAPSTLTFSPQSEATPGHARHVNLVVLDAASGKPVQALKLGC
jgi:hypothetical protein